MYFSPGPVQLAFKRAQEYIGSHGACSGILIENNGNHFLGSRAYGFSK